MSRDLFLHVMNIVAAHDPYFTQRRDAVGKLGLTSHQRVAACIRHLATGTALDDLDDRYRIGESTMRESLRRFCKAVQCEFGPTYLRSPTESDMRALLAHSESVGWPGIDRDILDCCHLAWKNCPKAWAGQYQGKSGEPTVVLEDVSDTRGRIWH
ncbi:hypothetical protein AaE_000018 [Aphanomyces astaci]|uniref:DDE Tnp4 domain-containing protein n=1 Tax=Aphanomyces astaci TaxID=112090 RepID=A0A6A5ALS7_APHAT|nr:hypothetical protein AaE_000018 [Aphanomyces astaci]